MNSLRLAVMTTTVTSLRVLQLTSVCANARIEAIPDALCYSVFCMCALLASTQLNPFYSVCVLLDRAFSMFLFLFLFCEEWLLFELMRGISFKVSTELLIIRIQYTINLIPFWYVAWKAPELEDLSQNEENRIQMCVFVMELVHNEISVGGFRMRKQQLG